MVYSQKWFLSKQKKKILNGISAYFNPGEMVAIMGPSGLMLNLKKLENVIYMYIGSGKTVLLDLLAGRSNLGSNRDVSMFVKSIFKMSFIEIGSNIR